MTTFGFGFSGIGGNGGGGSVDVADLNIIWVAASSIYTADGTVLKPYTTIQDGIDAAVSGQIVYVCPATYTENIVLKDGVNIVGSDREKVILTPFDSGSATITVPTTTTSEVKNISINGTGTNYTIDIGAGAASTSVTFNNCALSGGGSGYTIDSALFEGSITFNESTMVDGIFSSDTNFSGTFTFTGGSLSLGSSWFIIGGVNSVVTIKNSSLLTEGAVNSLQSDTLLIEGCTWTGFGVQLLVVTSFEIKSCVLTSSSSGSPMLIQAASSTGTFINVYATQASSTAQIITSVSGATTYFYDSVFIGNNSSTGYIAALSGNVYSYDTSFIQAGASTGKAISLGSGKTHSIYGGSVIAQPVDGFTSNGTVTVSKLSYTLGSLTISGGTFIDLDLSPNTKTITDATYTVLQGDFYHTLVFTHASGCTISLPDVSVPTQLQCKNQSGGSLTFAAGTGGSIAQSDKTLAEADNGQDTVWVATLDGAAWFINGATT